MYAPYPSDVGLVYHPSDGTPPGPLVGLNIPPGSEVARALELYRAGQELGAELTPGWEAEHRGHRAHVTFSATLWPTETPLALAFNTANGDHVSALIDMLSHRLLFLTDHATYQDVLAAGDSGGEFGRRIFGLPGAAAEQLQSVLGQLELLPGAN